MQFDPYRDHGVENAQDAAFQLHMDLIQFLTERFDLEPIQLIYDPRPSTDFGMAIDARNGTQAAIIMPVEPAHETPDYLDLMAPAPDADDPEYMRTGPASYPVASNRFLSLRLHHGRAV